MTGNVGDRESLDWIRSLSSNVHITRGDFEGAEFPENKTVQVSDWNIGLVHGH